MKKALITGIAGQDGSYLSEFLLDKGYKVFGLIRRSSSFNSNHRIEHLNNNKYFKTYYGDLSDFSNVNKLIDEVQPDEIYNLAAQSHVAISFVMPTYTHNINFLGADNILNYISSKKKEIRFYQASTSEIFGGEKKESYTENSAINPKSPYGISKAASYWNTINYRRSKNIFAINGILFNHESPRRGENFISRKVSLAISQIIKKKLDFLSIGNLDSYRDWGYAKEYVEYMWKMLNSDEPDDYIISTGKSISVRKFVELAFDYVGINLKWEGKGFNERGYDKKTGNLVIKVDKRYFRPNEVNFLKGNSYKAKKNLDLNLKTDIKKLIKIMVESDLNG